MSEQEQKPIWLGPPAPPYRSCAECFRPARLQCEGCGLCWCVPCWWKHSHTVKDFVLPFRGKVEP